MRRATLVLLVCVFVGTTGGVRADVPLAGVSEVYAGGGGTGATFRNDFVEVFNRSPSPIDVTGWRVAYSPSRDASWVTVALTGTLGPKRFYLVGFGSSGAVGALLPRPDATGAANLARGSGEVVLLDRSGRRVDLVGYGPYADTFEGHPAPAATTNGQSITRVPTPCSDTNRNDVDFRLRSPTPRNRASAGYGC